MAVDARRRMRLAGSDSASARVRWVPPSVARGERRCRTVRSFVLAVAVVLLLVGRVARPDEVTTGAIRGTVTDTSGAPQPGARVTVTSAEGSKVYVAQADGRFIALFLTPGTYTVRVEAPGLATAERHGIEVRLGRRVELAFALPAGAFTEALEVKAAPPVVDFSSVTASTGVNSSFLARLPVARRLSDVVYVAPGVSSGGGAGVANPSISGGERAREPVRDGRRRHQRSEVRQPGPLLQ